MKYIYNRVMAYFIDMLLVVVLATLISRISFINPNINNYNKYNKLYSDINLEYQGYVADLQKYYGDNKISKKEYDKIVTETNKSYMKQNKMVYYNLNKYSLVYNIIVLVLLVIYFVGFNIITKGQTLGKKLLNLQLVSVDDKEVSILGYIIRFLILYFPIYYLVVIIGPICLNVNSFYSLALVFSNIKNYFNVIIFASIMFRNDNRGLHDLVAKTKVIDTKVKKEDEVKVEVIKDKVKRKSKNIKKVIIDNKEN